MYDLLKGLRVVEASAFVAGPTCGLYLAQLGAEVIRIDTLGGGPDFGRWPLADNGASLYWEGLNKAKRSVAIDLSRPEGRALAQRLATAPGPYAGLFVTNFPAEGFLSYEKLRALRDDLICVRVMGWADGGPAVDYTINAAVGLPLMTGPVGDERPVNHVLPAWDLLTGAYAAFALVSALLDRRATGRGREVRLPLSDIAAATLANLGMTAEVLTTGAQRPRMGNDLFGAFGRDFVTGDGQRIMLVAITPRQWRGVQEVLGIADQVAALEADLACDFSTDEGLRFAHREALFAIFDRAFRTKPLAALTPAFEALGVCWGPYQPLETAMADPRLYAGNPLFADVAQPSGLTYPAPGFAGTIPQDVRAAPRPAAAFGADTEQVLGEVLGMPPAEIEALRGAGLI